MAHILITNDDGIQAEGLRALVQAVEGLGTISVVAPSYERSASAQSLTLRQPIFWEQVAEREWAVEGTPTDAVILALHKLLPNRPDLVISGINRGGNLGENIFYSGTVGAAMEAAINHVPAIAISLAHKGRAFRFEHAAKFARDLAVLALAEGMPQGGLLNVNVPLVWNGSLRCRRQAKKLPRTVFRKAPTRAGAASTGFWNRNISKGLTRKAITRRSSMARFPSRLCISTARTTLRSIICRSGRPSWMRRRRTPKRLP